MVWKKPPATVRQKPIYRGQASRSGTRTGQGQGQEAMSDIQGQGDNVYRSGPKGLGLQFKGEDRDHNAGLGKVSSMCCRSTLRIYAPI